MHKILEILSIKPYQIKAKFNNGEIRTINFLPLVERFTALKDPIIFAKAKIDDYPTISWDGLAKIQELDGTISPCALDFSPETLYDLSVLENQTFSKQS
jgi:Protein of unknown function (DUF2442)